DTGLLNGRLDVAAPDVSLAAALALMDASGSVNGSVQLAPQDGKQAASISAKASRLVVNEISVGEADISAGVADLFGVPVVDGTANASKIVAGGLLVDTLQARASNSGTTTNFEARAGLNIGTNIDVAGSLSPLDNGFRLGLDRANLVQGQLS